MIYYVIHNLALLLVHFPELYAQGKLQEIDGIEFYLAKLPQSIPSSKFALDEEMIFLLELG